MHGGSHWVHAAPREDLRGQGQCHGTRVAGRANRRQRDLLIESPAVAQRAASIANNTLHERSFSAQNFYQGGGSLTIFPPVGAAAGSYGASIIGVAFTASSPRVAQVGVNALLQAFDQELSATIAAQYNNAIAGIDQTIISTTDPDQRAVLLGQRNQLLVNEQTALSQQPTVLWAIEPRGPSSSSWKKTAAEGLVIGLVLGVAVAYVRASRRRGFIDQQDLAALYGVPLIGEIPALRAEKALRSNGAAADGLPMRADPHSAVAEAFRFAAGSVERIRAERGPRLSLVFVSPRAGAGKSMVVANLALAIAEGGTRVLVVDADAGDGQGLTTRLLLGTPADDGGLELVLAGQRPLAACIHPSPLNDAVAVLGSGPALHRRVTGAARAKAASALLATASSFDIVLIDSPGLLQVADAAEMVGASDAAIIVVGPDELTRDHVETVDRLKHYRVRCRRLHLRRSAYVGSPCQVSAQRLIGSPDGPGSPNQLSQRLIGSPDGPGSLNRGLSDSLIRTTK